MQGKYDRWETSVSYWDNQREERYCKRIINHSTFEVHEFGFSRRHTPRSDLNILYSLLSNLHSLPYICLSLLFAAKKSSRWNINCSIIRELICPAFLPSSLYSTGELSVNSVSDLYSFGFRFRSMHEWSHSQRWAFFPKKLSNFFRVMIF